MVKVSEKFLKVRSLNLTFQVSGSLKKMYVWACNQKKMTKAQKKILKVSKKWRKMQKFWNKFSNIKQKKFKTPKKLFFKTLKNF